jgi:hypothetical protein
VSQNELLTQIQGDTMLLISFSGNTPELHNILPHIPTSIPLIALTSHINQHSSPLTRNRPNTIMLPAPIHESEESSFGVGAPTTSTTAALAVGDALCISVARRMHVRTGRSPKNVFKANHPGGAIGLKIKASEPTEKNDKGTTLASIGVLIDSIPIVSCASGDSLDEPRIADALLAAVQNPLAKGWVRVENSETKEHSFIAPRQLRKMSGDLGRRLVDVEGLLNQTESFFLLPERCHVDDLRSWLAITRKPVHGKCGGKCIMDGVTIFGLVDADRNLCRVLELDDMTEFDG